MVLLGAVSHDRVLRVCVFLHLSERRRAACLMLTCMAAHHIGMRRRSLVHTLHSFCSCALFCT